MFNYAREEQDRKIQAVQGEIDAIKRGEFNYYVPPTYINKIKKMDKTITIWADHKIMDL